MLVFPNAKINLGLYVTRKREDGFHDIETVFYPIPLTDVLEFIPSKTGRSSISVHGIALDSEPKDNLVFKAYTLLKKKFQLPPIHISLLKQIPVGAGLGGGSADGAFMLTALNQFFELGISVPELESYALQLGSDCPFFIENTPKLARGRGELFEKTDFDCNALTLVLVNPGIHISTKMAYKGVKPANPAYPLKETIEGSLINWKDQLKNDFEPHVFKAHPEINNIKQYLYEQGAVYASMSGSGSSVFGIFDDMPRHLNLPDNYFVWQGRL